MACNHDWPNVTLTLKTTEANPVKQNVYINDINGLHFLPFVKCKHIILHLNPMEHISGNFAFGTKYSFMGFYDLMLC